MCFISLRILRALLVYGPIYGSNNGKLKAYVAYSCLIPHIVETKI